MKKIICMIIILLTLTGCGNIATNDNNQSAGKPNNKEQSENKTSNGNNGNVAKKLISCDIDFYGTINENSQYVAAIVHNGNIEKWYPENENAKKTYVAVYDMGEPIGETNALTDEWINAISNGRYLYNFCIGGKNGVFKTIINNTNWEDGAADFSLTDGEKSGYRLMGNNEYSVISNRDKNFTNKNFVYGKDWITNAYDDIIYAFDVKIGETDNDNFYVQVFLETPLAKTDNLQTKIQNALDNNEIKHSIIILNNSDDISNVNRVIGKEYNLTEVSFLQDLLANKISTAYGLNLKDKDVELHLDMDYIKYRGYNKDNEYVVVSFEPIENYEDYMYLLEDMKTKYQNNFEYTDSNGNTYNYFVDGKQFYIYKNGNKVGAGTTNTDDAFTAISVLFGVKS